MPRQENWSSFAGSFLDERQKTTVKAKSSKPNQGTPSICPFPLPASSHCVARTGVVPPRCQRRLPPGASSLRCLPHGVPLSPPPSRHPSSPPAPPPSRHPPSPPAPPPSQCLLPMSPPSRHPAPHPPSPRLPPGVLPLCRLPPTALPPGSRW